MIRCPKCSFEQPPDRYCARCGVNMETFKAPKAPLSRRLAGSGGFNIFLITTVIVATVYFVYQRRTESTESATKSVNQNAPSVQKALPTPVSESPLANAPAAAEQEPAPPHDQVAEKLREAAEILFSKTPHQGSTSSTTFNEAAITSKTKILIHFFEVPTSVLATLTGAENEAPTGSVSDFSARLAEARKQLSGENRIVGLARFERPATNQPISLDQTLGEGRGFFLRLQPSQESENTLDLQVSWEFRGPLGLNAAPGLTVQEGDSQFQLLNRGAGFLIDPFGRQHSVKPEDETSLAQHPIFKIFGSPSFKQNSSSLLVVFEVTGLSDER